MSLRKGALERFYKMGLEPKGKWIYLIKISRFIIIGMSVDIYILG